MMTFDKFNETANYYSKTSRTTGINVWNQEEIQCQFIELVEKCDLTKEQIDNLESFMIENNATIDMAPTKNNSSKEFSIMAKSNNEVIGKSKIA